jgi:hypothetical protein
MMEENQSIMKNDVWKVAPRPEGKSVVTSKWIYKIKHVADGSIEKYKARFVARGFSQQEGEDYDETLAPVARRSVHRAATKIHEKESHVCRLKKALYKLKQAPRAGYARQLFLMSLGMVAH